MRNETLREGRQNLPLKHYSARGRPPRNSGNFTRGGQLASHEWMMFYGAVKIPAYVWLASVAAAYWVIMSMVMGEHEIQLCSWRIGSWLWTAMDFRPYKPMNIVLADDSMRRVPIGYIPYVPDVQIAWTKAGHALIGALVAGSAIAFPVAAGLIRYFKRNGAAFMEERHERGAMLVERSLLVADIMAHNGREFEKSAAKLFPGLKPAEVSAMPFAARKKAGLHHPYSLGGVPFPYGLEQSHTIIVGTTGSGKTTQLKSIVTEMRARGDSAVVFDLTGSFIESFYDPTTDVILNPGDARCPCWSVFEDCTTEAEFTAASQALIPHDGGGSDPFWVATARLLFVQMCMKLQQHGLTTNSALADNLVKADLKRLHRILKDTAAGVLTDPDAAKMATSIRSVYVANANALSSLPEDGEFFSIRDWVRRDDKPGSILFVSARYVDLALYKTMLTLWLDIAVNTLMTLPRTNGLRTWYMFDELGALHRLGGANDRMDGHQRDTDFSNGFIHRQGDALSGDVTDAQNLPLIRTTPFIAPILDRIYSPTFDATNYLRANGIGVKPGADVTHVDKHMQMPIAVVSNESRALGLAARTITSGRDSPGVHMEGSLHGDGRAFDFRGRDISITQGRALEGRVSRQLGSDYDVKFETFRDPSRNHLHVEYDPKPPKRR